MAFARCEPSNTCDGEGYSTHNNENTSTHWQQRRLAKCHLGPASPADAHVSIVGAGQLALTLIPCSRHPGLHFQSHSPLESCRRRWSHPLERSGDDFPWRKSVIADPS